MQKPDIIYVSPARDNILYTVVDKPKDGVGDFLKHIVGTLKVERSNMGRIIIFCKTYTNVYQYFKRQLGEYFTEPKGYPTNNVNYRMVDVYTQCTHDSVKKKIIT